MQCLQMSSIYSNHTVAEAPFYCKFAWVQSSTFLPFIFINCISITRSVQNNQLYFIIWARIKRDLQVKYVYKQHKTVQLRYTFGQMHMYTIRGLPNSNIYEADGIILNDREKPYDTISGDTQSHKRSLLVHALRGTSQRRRTCNFRVSNKDS